MPEITSNPDINSAFDLPQISASQKQRSIHINILKNSEAEQCSFWLALSKPGPLNVTELIDKTDILTVFHSAMNVGVVEGQPSLLVNANKTTERYIFLLPMEEENDFRPKAIWMAELSSAIKALKVTKIGFYIPPQTITENSSYNLFDGIMRHLILSTAISDFYLLTGDHGVNAITNSALLLKEDLDQEEQIKITIFH